MFIQTLWLEKRSRELPVYLPREGIEPLKQMLRATYLFDEAIGFSIRFEAISPTHPVSIRSIQMTAHTNTHLHRTRERHSAQYPAAYESFSFLLSGEGTRIAHTADLGAPSDVSALLSQPLEWLVCELAHFEPDTLFQSLQGAKLKRLLLTHIKRAWVTNPDALKKMAQRLLPETHVQIARDGDHLTLG